jgi:hypothetical protein
MTAPAARSNGHDTGSHLGYIHVDGQSLVNDLNAMGRTMVRVETTVNNVQDKVNGISTRLDKIEPRVWAIPGGSLVVAVAALVISAWGKFGG